MVHNISWQWLSTTFVRIVIYAGIVQGGFLALVLTTRKNKNRPKNRGNRMLAILLIVLSISILHSVFASFDTTYKIKEPLILLIGPLLLFYVRDSIGIRSVGSGNFLHFVPFLLLLFFLIAPHELILNPSAAYPLFFSRNTAVISIGVWTLIVVQYGFYWWKTSHMIYHNVIAVESEFSNIEGKTLSWLKIFIHVFGILLVLFAGTVIFVVHGGHYSEVDTIVSFGLSCAIFVLGYEGLFQKDIFSIMPAPGQLNQSRKLPEASGPEPVISNRLKIGDSTKSEETNAEEDRLYEGLLLYFDEKKPWLDEELTLTKLAEQLEVTRNQLSSTINNKSGSNFYTFVNKYRVDEVKRLLADPRNKNFTILSLAFQAGFSSKSSFHDIFKKFTGITPTEYQRMIEHG